MNYCSACGFKLPPKAKFCPQCGVAVNAAISSDKDGHTVQVDSSISDSQTVQVDSSTSDALTSSQKRLLSSAVMLAIIVAGVYYYVGFVSTLDAKTIQHSADDGHNHPAEQQQSATAQQQQMPVPSAAEIQRIQQALDNDPDNVELELQLGNMLFDSQRYREAIGRYTTVLAKDPNNADVRVDLGVSHFNLQDFKSAEDQFQLALKLEPKHLNGLYNMGIVSLKLGEVNKLISYWGKLIELAPESGQAQQAKKYLEELHQEIDQFPQDQQNIES